MHVDVQLEIGKSISRPCPLRQYGCAEEVCCLSPAPQGSRLRYDQRHSTFALVHTPVDAGSEGRAADRKHTCCELIGSHSPDAHEPLAQSQAEEHAMHNYDDEWCALLELPPEVRRRAWLVEKKERR